MPYASVYPLVTARALARPFTYEVEDGIGKGAVVSVPLGRARVRGVVVGAENGPPDGVRTVSVSRVLDELPPTLVDLALWLAEYYGSTQEPALRYMLAAEPAPARLSDAQEAAVERIGSALDNGGGHLLLFGATGSGKTEVYLRACAAALERGRGAIVLVPEIALTPQTVGRFRARFGDEVAILHSALSEAERRDERERIATGDARIVVGARSAVFAPVPALGVVCVDEEHDASYKPESWERLERIELGGRITARLPPVRIVDVRRESYPLSAPLLEELGAIADRGGKAILLLNRRGVAPALHCRACGTTIRCEHCDVSLVLHADRILRCHHCGYPPASPEAGPACGSPELARLGAGTQRLERELEARVPELERIRLDADAVDRPGALADALRRFAPPGRPPPLRPPKGGEGHHFSRV